MDSVAEALPPWYVAITVYVAAGATAVGVPLMTPEVELNERPAGREGLMDQLLMVAFPLTCGSMLTAWPTVEAVEAA